MSTQDQQYQTQLDEMKALVERQSTATTTYETDLGSISQAKEDCVNSAEEAKNILSTTVRSSDQTGVQVKTFYAIKGTFADIPSDAAIGDVFFIYE